MLLVSSMPGCEFFTLNRAWNVVILFCRKPLYDLDEHELFRAVLDLEIYRE